MHAFSKILLEARPYRYLLLLNDFVRRREFKVQESTDLVTFDFMGDATSFFVPSQFSTYHDIVHAIRWMQASSNIQLKHGTVVYTLNHIEMPVDYDQGNQSQMHDALHGLAILASLRTPSKLTHNMIIDEALNLKLNPAQRMTVDIDRYKRINVEVRLYKTTIEIIRDPKFLYTLMPDVKEACDYMSRPASRFQLDRIRNSKDYELKLQLGNNRAVIHHDSKLFEQRSGTYKEIYLESSS